MQIYPQLRLYALLLGAGLQAKLHHRADFLIMAGTAILMQGTGYVFLWIVFRQIPSVAGWSFWELVVVYAMVFVTEGCVSLFFEGLWRFSSLLNRGEFEVFLLRPVSPVLQTLVHDVGINGLGNIILGAVMIAQALWRIDVDWSPLRVLIAVVLLISAVIVRGSIVLAAASLGFWMGGPQNSAMNAVHCLSSFAQFPLSIYGRGLQVVLTFGIPLAFISYYPAAWMFGKRYIGWLGLITPVVAVYAVLAARAIFRLGLRRYEGAGN